MNNTQYHKQWEKTPKGILHLERRKINRKTSKGRKQVYMTLWNKSNVTDAHWETYSNATHCECCDIELTIGTKNLTTKCQDHNHDTGELRGVICTACNTAEGYLKTPERAYQVACYMASHTPLNELIKGLP